MTQQELLDAAMQQGYTTGRGVGAHQRIITRPFSSGIADAEVRPFMCAWVLMQHQDECNAFMAAAICGFKEGQDAVLKEWHAPDQRSTPRAQEQP